MPYINQLRYWAGAHPHRPAVVVGRERLSFAQLVEAATLSAASRPSEARPLTVIDEPNGIRLALLLTSAVAGSGVAAVLDTAWPGPLKKSIKDKAAAWALAQPVGPAVGGFCDGPGGSTFLLGFSSGTSGVPKAFTRSRESWRVSFAESERYFGVAAGDVTLAPGPMAASMNLYALGEALSAGSTFVALPQFSADAALQAITHDAVTRLVLVPTVLALMAQRGLDTGRGAGGISSIVCAGAALSPDVLELARRWAPGARIFQYYGAAELGFVAAVEAVEDDQAVEEDDSDADDRAGSGVRGPSDKADASGNAGGSDNAPCVGSAFPGVELSVRGSDGQPCGTGEIGSIYVHGPYVANGYAWGDDGLAFNALPAGAAPGKSWYTVHDQGFIDGGGLLHVVGRASDMIITGGANVYPQQVEAALAAGSLGVPGAVVMTDAVVVTGVPDAVRGQRVAAGLYAPAALDGESGLYRGSGVQIQTSLPGESGKPDHTRLTTAMLLAHCRERAAELPAHQRPTVYYALAELPLTGSGKTSRTLLQSWISEGDPRAQRIK